MLFIAIILVFIGGCAFLLRLWAIRKHNQVLYTMYDYRREVTGLMRSDRFSNEKISQTDYRKLRRTLDNTNLVIDDFEQTKAHPLAFFRYLKNSGKQAFRADIRQKKLPLAHNEEVKHQQKNLQRLLSWSVYYTTPSFFRNKSLLQSLLNLFGCSRKKVAPQNESYSEWIAQQVSNPLTKDFSAEV